MSKHILYNFPSRNRIAKFETACENIKALSVDQNYTILAKIDQDDYDYDKYLYYICTLSKDDNLELAPGLSDSKIHAVNRDIPVDGWDIIVTMSDDMIWQVQGFDNIIRQYCGPDDFVHFPDGYVNKRLCTLPIMGSQYYHRDGYIGHPSYKSLWADNEWQEVALRRKRYKYVPKRIVKHDHPAWTGAPKDALLIHTESFHAEDKANFERRKSEGFPK